jgi:hypothetical protein
MSWFPRGSPAHRRRIVAAHAYHPTTSRR